MPKTSNEIIEKLMSDLKQANQDLKAGEENFEAYANAHNNKPRIIRELVSLKLQERKAIKSVLDSISIFGSHCSLPGLNVLIASYSVGMTEQEKNVQSKRKA